MGAVDIGVGHDDDLPVARSLQVEGAPGPGSDDLDDGGALGVAEHVGHRGLLHVEDLAADGEQRLVVAAAGELGRAERAVALDDEELGALDVVAAAVSELRRERGGLQRGLPALGLLVHTGTDPRLHLRGDLLQQEGSLLLLAPLGREEPSGELAFDHPGDDGTHGRGAQDLLGLPLELRLGEPYGHDRREPGEGVVLLQLVGADLQPARIDLELFAQHLEHGLVEAGEVGPALRGGDDVDEGGHRRVVAGPPAHRDVDAALALDLGRCHVALGVEHRHGLGEGTGALEPPHVGDGGVACQVVAELRDAAVVDEGLLDRLLAPLVADEQGQARHEEGRLARPPEQPLQVEVGLREEDLPVGPVAHPRAGDPAAGLADDDELAVVGVGRERVVGVLAAPGAGDVGEQTRLPAPEAHRPGLATSVDLHVEARGQRVDHGTTDPVQTPGRRVGPATELPAGVQPGVDQLDTGQAGARLDVDRYAPTVVAHLHRPVAAQDHLDVVAVPTERLVDRVVDDLPQAVHDAAGVGGPDVHPRPLAHRLQPLEHLEVVSGVAARGRALRGLAGSGAGHVWQGIRAP